jgi:sulfur-oxidizing protein SoxX
MRQAIRFLICAGLLFSTSVFAQQPAKVDAAAVEAAIKQSWASEPAEWQQRLVQDETMQQCTQYRNNPPAAVAAAIVARAKASVVYPGDGKLLGDWKKGEVLAQSGYGLRFTDKDTSRANGGNCYACHQVDKKEVSHGTLGPSLAGYGKLRNFGEADAKAVYERIYNSHTALPCSNMPRFGAAKILTIEQIKDAVALLMDRDSPVNK